MDTGYGYADGLGSRRQVPDRRVAPVNQGTNLAELLERVLDKGIVIAGDITISLAEVQLLTIKVRLLIASVDKAQEIGINWWQSDASLSSRAQELERENRLLRERLDRLEARLAPAPDDHADARNGHEAHPALMQQPEPPLRSSSS
ncbi:MAG TPA: gas vesicle protein [Ktedonobacterales bacterium]|nr:gas vesicle protein [Ktedonobacterales bacterium]